MFMRRPRTCVVLHRFSTYRMRNIIVRNGRRADTPFAPSTRGLCIIRASHATPAATIGGE